MHDEVIRHEQQPTAAGAARGRSKLLEWVVIVVLIAAVPFGLRGCFVAKGAYHHEEAPKLRFIGEVTQREGAAAFRGNVSFELVFRPLDGRRAFVEILTAFQYETVKDESYVGGWGEHQGSWGGRIYDAQVVGEKSLVRLPPMELPSGKYWVRTALFARNTYGDGDSQFDRLLYGLVGKPVDYKSGYYFLNEAGPGTGTLNRAYYASRYYPFWVLPD